MLVFGRLKDESVMIGDDVKITVCDIKGNKIKIGIEAPRNKAVHRLEVWEAIRAAKSND